MNGASRGLLPPGDPHYFNRTRGDAFRKVDGIVIAGTPFGMTAFDMETATRGQLRDLPGVDSLYFTMLNHNRRSITSRTARARRAASSTPRRKWCA